MANQDIRPPSTTGGSVSAAFRAGLTVLVFAAAFCVLQRLTFALRFLPFQRATIWTPGVPLFAALLLEPPRRWWIYYAGLCLGVFAAFQGERAVPVASALLAAQFHFGAVALGTWSIRRSSTGPPFGSPIALLVFAAVACLLVPIITVAPIELVRFLSGADDVWSVALRSLLAGALGLLIGTPALTLTLANGRAWFRAGSWKRFAELAGLASCLVAVDYVCFVRPAGGETLPALLYAPLPLLLWAAMRFGIGGVSWALLAVAFQSTGGAIHGRGPFSSPDPADNVLQLQLFLLAISLPLMFLATVIQERSQALATISQEITERRQAEERFRLVVESMPCAIVMVNAQGNILLVNSQAEKSFGYRRDELVGRLVEILVPERFRTKHPGYRASFFATPSARPMGAGHDLHGRRKDGSEFPVEIGLTPVRTSDGLFVLSAIVDINERKRAEEMRQQLAHAGRLAIVGELTACIAHELNQPLGAILSNADAAEMLLESSSASLDEVRQILADIRRDDVRASEVIQRLRGMLRKREMEMQPLDLNRVISEVLALIRMEFGRRSVLVETELAADLPPVRGDKVHLQQILLNILLNGMEAMADMPGVKTIAVRAALNDNGEVEIAVSDAGPGVPPDRLPRLFDSFFSTKKAGMGLGLSITRSLVEAHGGRIWAENDPGGGATFRFTVPTGVQQPGSESPATRRAPLELIT